MASAVQLADLGEVVDSVQDLRNAGSSNGKPSVLIIIFRQPNANIIETVDSVTAMLPLLRASIPTRSSSTSWWSGRRPFALRYTMSNGR